MWKMKIVFLIQNENYNERYLSHSDDYAAAADDDVDNSYRRQQIIIL